MLKTGVGPFQYYAYSDYPDTAQLTTNLLNLFGRMFRTINLIVTLQHLISKRRDKS